MNLQGEKNLGSKHYIQQQHFFRGHPQEEGGGNRMRLSLKLSINQDKTQPAYEAQSSGTALAWSVFW